MAHRDQDEEYEETLGEAKINLLKLCCVMDAISMVEISGSN